MVRRGCVALFLAIALAAVGIGLRGASPSERDARHELRPGAHSELSASVRDAQVDHVFPTRRVVSDGHAKPLLLTFATLSAACAFVLAGAVGRRGVGASPTTRSSLGVPCAPRAPPVLDFA